MLVYSWILGCSRYTALVGCLFPLDHVMPMHVMTCIRGRESLLGTVVSASEREREREVY
jgi:hypothetical protein